MTGNIHRRLLTLAGPIWRQVGLTLVVSLAMSATLLAQAFLVGVILVRLYEGRPLADVSGLLWARRRSRPLRRAGQSWGQLRPPDRRTAPRHPRTMSPDHRATRREPIIQALNADEVSPSRRRSSGAYITLVPGQLFDVDIGVKRPDRTGVSGEDGHPRR